MYDRQGPCHDTPSLRTALNAHAMGDIELPEASDMVQDFKRRHSRKAGAGAVNKIKRFSTRKGILKRGFF